MASIIELISRQIRRVLPKSVRARATVAATSVVALALGFGSLALNVLMFNQLIQNAEDAANEQATTVAQLAEQGRLTVLVPLVHGADFIQVVNADGRVVAASQNLAGYPALDHGRPSAPATWNHAPFGDQHRQRVVSVTANTPGGQLTVYAGSSLRDVDAASDFTAAALAVGVPLLLLTVAVVTWRVTGRALRPVEEIRAEVAEITHRALHRRVPVPGTQDEIARLAVTMNQTLDRLEESGIRQRRFIADASHELRSPITVLRTQLEVALAHPDPALWADLVEEALEDTVRLQDLAADLLLLARLDASDRVPNEPIDLAELCRETLAARPADRITVTAELTPGLTVIGNRSRLTRLLTNLLDNAQRYARERIDLALHADPASGTARLEVRDDGPGIPHADRDRVFERFTRLDDARSRDLGGTGLGLAIARDITTHHGGTLTAEPSPTGAHFRAVLPLAEGR